MDAYTVYPAMLKHARKKQKTTQPQPPIPLDCFVHGDIAGEGESLLGADGSTDPPEFYWTGEEMTTAWLCIHALFELVGSAAFVFGGALSACGSSPSAWSDAAAYSGVWTFFRTARQSASLDPLQSIPELIVYKYHSTTVGLIKVVSSVIAQLTGSVIGAYLVLVFLDGDTSGLIPAVASEAADRSYNPWILALGDFIWCLIIAGVSYTYQLQTMRDWKLDKDNKKEGGRAPDTLTASTGSFIQPKIEGAAVGSVLLAAIALMYSFTGGSFIITRSFGPAFVTGIWTNLGWYFLGQVGAHMLVAIIYWRYFHKVHESNQKYSK